MKTAKLMATGLCVLLTSLSVTAHAKLNSPKPGVLCDQYLCADKNGLSKSLTGNYLDQTRAKKITGNGTDLTQFTFSDGTFCDSTAKLCYTDRYFDSNGKRSPVAQDATQKLFGKNTAVITNSKLRSPKQGVLCDEDACADKNGLSKSLTGNYLDQTRAKNITGKGTDLTQFTFSDGTFCDAKAKKCYTDRYFDSNGKRSPINKDATKKLFGR